MSFNILSNKETDHPAKSLLLCKIVAVDGDTCFFCTTPAQGSTNLTYGGNTYQARIQDQNIGAIQAMSPQGYDIPGSFNLTIADGDFSIWANHIKPHGWRGGTLTATLVFWDIPTNAYSTDSYQWTFILGNPKPPANGVITVESTTKTSMTRLKVPNVMRQATCPWVYPTQGTAQAVAGLSDPTSIYFQCGHSFGVSGGIGDDDLGTPCNYTRQDCQRLGMFSTDWGSGNGFRFGGDTWQPPLQFSGRQYTSGQKITGFNQSSNGPGQYYPLLYGTQWVDCVVLEPAADPNSLRAEVIVCVATDGPVNILKLLVNGVEIPQKGSDVLFTWRYVNQGGRNGKISGDAIYDGQGDPHGSLCCIEFVVPAQLAAGGSVPKVQALAQGPPTLVTDGAGGFSYAYNTNPVFHLMDLLTWGPFFTTDFDSASWFAAAAVCNVPISYLDRNGTSQTHERYRSSFVLSTANRQALSGAVLALRNCAGILLAKNPNTGLLQCVIEQTLADQQPSAIPGSNDVTGQTSVHADGTSGTGYFAYIFDGAGSIEKGTLDFPVRSINDTPNQVVIQIQDKDNAYQQDSVSTIDPEAYVSSGNQQIDVPLQIIGPDNFDQATRRSNVELAKALRGNPRNDAGGTLGITFTTTVHAAHLPSAIGAICGLKFEQLF